jgi:hypothetical protein
MQVRGPNARYAYVKQFRVITNMTLILDDDDDDDDDD